MIKIAICDDEKIFLSSFHRILQKICNELNISVEIFDYSYSNILLHHHSQDRFDVIFLDIDMPKISGFEAAQIIRNISSEIPIVFVTAKDDLVYYSFEYHPFHFIRKRTDNILYNDTLHVMQKLLTHFGQFKTTVITSTEIGKTIVSIKNIVYIKSEKHYLYYYIYKKGRLCERNTISQINNYFSNLGFIRSHQRYLINYNHIEKIDTLKNEITISNGEIIPISKQYREFVIEKYISLKRK